MTWKIRNSDDTIPLGMLTPDYGQNTEYFTIRIHHSGRFLNFGTRCYLEGEIGHVDYCTQDEMSKLELSHMVADMGLSGYVAFYYSTGGVNDCKSLVYVDGDMDAMNLSNFAGKEKIVGLFVDHEKMDSLSLSCQSEPLEENTQHFPDVDEPLDYVGDIDEPIDDNESDEVPNVIGNTSYAPDEVPNMNDEPTFDFSGIIDNNDSGGSDGEVSIGEDSVYSDFLVDSDCDYDDDNQDFDDNIDPEVEWGGFRGLKGKKPCIPEYIEDHAILTSKKTQSAYNGYKVFNPKIDMENVRFQVGLCFSDSQVFRDALKKYAIDNGRSLVFPKNEKYKVQAICKQKMCPWVIYESRIAGEDTMQVKTFHNTHECSRQERVTQANSRWLANKYIDKLKYDPNWPVHSMLAIMQKENKLLFSKHQMYRVKEKVNSIGHGDEAEQYAILWKYAEEIRTTNPDTTVRIKCKLLTNQAMFKRFYVCWGALKRGMLDGCRPIICLDGCHLKTTYGGVLLTAVGIDANNCMYPFAYAVVEKEKRKSWLWFLSMIVQDLNMTNSYVWTIMSDKQKGLIEAVQELLPNCEHRFCVMHLYGNFKSAHKGLALKDILWKAARATRVVDFERVMLQLKDRDHAAFEWLVKRPPAQWSKSHFSTFCKSDILLNNMSESFNALILRARSLPIIQMLEAVRIILMKRLGVKREQMKKWHSEICPKIAKLLDELKKKAMDYIPHYNGEQEFEVEGFYGDRHTIHLRENYCSCRRWQLTGIPCAHAISGMYFMGYKPENFVDQCYKKDTFLKIYSHLMKPMKSQESWPETRADLSLVPPKIESMPGRPKKHKRKLQHDEVKGQKAAATQSSSGKLSKKGLVMTCKTCGVQGHNSRTCPLKKRNPLADPNLDVPARNNDGHTTTKEIHGQGSVTEVAKGEKSKVVASSIDAVSTTQDSSVTSTTTTRNAENKKKKLQTKGKSKCAIYSSNDQVSATSPRKNKKKKEMETIDKSIVANSSSQPPTVMKSNDVGKTSNIIEKALQSTHGSFS